VELIQQDASIASKVIATANSPLYRQFNQINDIDRLVVVLGLDTVRTIAITSAVQHFFSQATQSIGGYLDRLWYHSLSCAHIAQSLAELTAYERPAEAYLSGLLHRLGQLALLWSQPQAYTEIYDQGLRGESLNQAELKRFGVGSCEVAAQLVDSWGIRSFISDALRYQLEPTQAILDATQLVKLVNLARLLASGTGDVDDTALAKADQLFGLNQSVIEGVVVKAGERTQALARGLGIHSPSTTSQRRGSASDAAMQRALGERIQGLALFGGDLNRSQSSDLQQVLGLIQRDLGLLFGLHSSCFLLYEPQAERLRAVSMDKAILALLADIDISTRDGGSLAAQVFNSRSMLCSLNQGAPNPAPSVVDRQLAHILAGEGLLYLPLTPPQRPFGLLVAAVDADTWERLRPQTWLLTLFTEAAVKRLLHQREQAAMEQQRRQEQREQFQLEVRKLVHEANNPLGIINNYLHILGMKLGDDRQIQEELTIIKEEIERAGSILLRMRDIPEKLEHQSELVDINDLIRDLVKLFRASLFASHRIEARLVLDEKIPPLPLNRGKLKQVLTNLIKNAAESMPQGGGELTITTQDDIHMNGMTYVGIQVDDNGPGIPTDVLQHLFTPVASRKGGAHSGLGLAIVKNLMDELSGSINCVSNAESGTRFQLFLPRIPRPESNPE